ncbi:leukocyte elastase inhibitor-like [Schistocerca piceifrons]|uniref:leukocyte elastase inhibitor-like n=1 Tax=Schistocerca piceifrons TaxID=274613 RepID=UPI001F5F5B50|nr:leukocyte elastase inhibitor-like [Schistocerca piceifrons]
MVVAEANVALETISQANSLFTFDIYKDLANGTDNLFFSPISIQVILALVFLGARGDTAKQIARGLRLPEDRNVTEDGFSALTSRLQESNDVLLNVANRIFIKNGFNIKEEFNNSAISFKAGAEVVDFSQEEAARKIINDWVENKTNQKIKSIIPPGVLNDLTRMVLVNAIYFKGEWQKRFNKALTSPTPFHVAPGSTQSVNMMYIKENFKYSDVPELESQVLLLPYKGERVSMLIILPREQNGLPNLEKKLTNITLQDILARTSKREVRVFLPKFKLEYEKELTTTLQTLGITDVFDASRANLTRISDEPLAISKVLHKAFIEVNEEGTEAAAATAVLIGLSLTLPLPDPPVIFKADHPFVFLILDQQTHTVLFAGRYSTPPS